MSTVTTSYVTTSEAPMTVQDFDKLADPPGGRLELRHGVPYPVTFPKWDHEDVQNRLLDLLKPAFWDKAVHAEMAFRPLPEHELWAADIGIVSRERKRASRQHGWLLGSPEIVVEVVTPSNSSDEMEDRERTCFAGGTQQFWAVHLKTRHVRVTHADGRTERYQQGQEIPAGTVSIPVTDIFAVLD